MSSNQRSNDLLLMLPADEGGALWKIDLAAEEGGIARLDRDAEENREAFAQFGRGMTVGAPAGDGDGDAYKLDLTQLARRVQSWIDAPRSSARPAFGQSVQAGPHDVVVPVRTDDGVDLRVVQMDVETRERADGKGRELRRMTPIGLGTLDDDASREAIMTFFHTGTCLTFLQQTTFPVGFTCYLLNTLALDDVDPDRG